MLVKESGYKELMDELQAVMDEESEMMRAVQDKFPEEESVQSASSPDELLGVLYQLSERIARDAQPNMVERYSEVADAHFLLKVAIERWKQSLRN